MTTPLQHLVNETPDWVNWVVIGGSAAVAWIQPAAGIVAIVWGCLQIYGWVEKRVERRLKTRYALRAVLADETRSAI